MWIIETESQRAYGEIILEKYIDESVLPPERVTECLHILFQSDDSEIVDG